jgi:DNA replication protein DnaC
MDQVKQNLTGTLPDFAIPYILTQEMEDAAIERKVNSLKDLYQWKAKERHRSTSEIESHLKNHDFTRDFDVKEYLKQINDLTYWDIDEKNRKEQRIQSEKQEMANLSEKCDYKYMYRLLQYNSRKNGREFDLNNYNSMYVKALCFFLSMDKRFESELGYDFKKGLLIRGPYGVGKTYILKCLLDNELQPIEMKSMIDITRMVEREGECFVNIYKKRKLVLDDVGTEEPTVNHYGTKISWFKDFIETHYTSEKVFPRLIITTNCSFDEIEQRYGGRVRSRMAAMFNVIDVKGEDLRKKKA